MGSIVQRDYSIGKLLRENQKLNSIYLKQEGQICLPQTKDDNFVICRSASLYYFDEPADPDFISAACNEIAALFNIDRIKVNFMIEIMVEDRWSERRVRDAIKHVMKNNIYATAEKGMEPGKILSFDRDIKLYEQHQVIDLNGKGIIGFSIVKTPFTHKVQGETGIVESNYWYIKDADLPLIPANW